MSEDDQPSTRVWRCFGRAVGVRAPGVVLAHFDGLVPPSVWQPTTAAAERLWEVSEEGPAFNGWLDGCLFGSWNDPWEAARALRSDMEIWVGASARDFVLVHASVVAVDDRALLLPGPSMSGKSTLAAALLRAGAVYLSDEFAVLDRIGFVHPYPRPLCIREDQGRRRDLTQTDLGPSRQFGDQGLRVRLLAELAFEAAGEGLDVREISRAEAVLVLLANAVAARTQPEAVLEAAVATVAHAICFSGIRGEATGSASELLELLSSAASPDHGTLVAEAPTSIA